MVFKRWGLWEVIGSWGWSPHKWDCCSDARSCLTLCNLMNYSTLDSSVLHYLLEFDETHVHWVSDNSNNLILCYPLLFLPSIFPSGTFPLSQLFASCGQSIGASTLATVLQWIFRVDFFSDWLAWYPCSPRDCQESCPTPQFESINSSSLRLLYSPNFTSEHDYWKNNSFNYTDLFWQIVPL